MKYTLETTDAFDRWFGSKVVVFLLAGGDKSSQRKNIEQAIRLLNKLED